MAENTTTQNPDNVAAYLAGVEDEQGRADALVVCDVMARVTGEPATMWGTSMVAFGHMHLRYDSGRELDWFLVGFAPRKQSTTPYVGDGFDAYDALLNRLGKHSTGKSCLYIKRLSGVDLAVLEQLLRESVAHQRGIGSHPALAR